MELLIYIKNKKAESSILLAIFFLIIVLIMLSLFISFHKTILNSNYNINYQYFNEKQLYSLKEELLNCYSYPLKIDSIETCSAIKDLNFQIKIIKYGVCEDEILIENGKKYLSSSSLFIPVLDTNLNICPAQIYLYFEK